jgi:hypothetical protein
VVTQVTLEESALAQQIPEDWAADLQLTQEQIGNAVPLGISYYLGVAIADYLRPHLLARAEIEKGEVIAPIASPPSPFPTSPPLQAFLARSSTRWFQPSRREANRVEAMEPLTAVAAALCAGGPACQAKSDAEGSAALAGSRFEGHREQPRWLLRRAATLLAASSGSALVAVAEASLSSVLRDGQRLPLQAEPDRCFKPNAPSAIHPNVDHEFARLRRLGYT